MLRPCYLVCDPEHAGTISTRKLVIETAKLNVITSYSGAEALETLEAFPAVSGAVLDAAISDMSCAELVGQIKARWPRLPVVVIGTVGAHACPGADFYLTSFEPQRLLTLLQGLEPERIARIEQQTRRLEAKEEAEGLSKVARKIPENPVPDDPGGDAR